MIKMDFFVYFFSSNVNKHISILIVYYEIWNGFVGDTHTHAHTNSLCAFADHYFGYFN